MSYRELLLDKCTAKLSFLVSKLKGELDYYKTHQSNTANAFIVKFSATTFFFVCAGKSRAVLEKETITSNRY